MHTKMKQTHVFKHNKSTSFFLLMMGLGLPLLAFYKLMIGDVTGAQAAAIVSVIISPLCIFGSRTVNDDVFIYNEGIAYKPFKKQIGLTFVPWEELCPPEVKEVMVNRIGSYGEILTMEIRDGAFKDGLEFSIIQKITYGKTIWLPLYHFTTDSDLMYQVIQEKIHIE